MDGESAVPGWAIAVLCGVLTAHGLWQRRGKSYNPAITLSKRRDSAESSPSLRPSVGALLARLAGANTDLAFFYQHWTRTEGHGPSWASFAPSGDSPSAFEPAAEVVAPSCCCCCVRIGLSWSFPNWPRSRSGPWLVASPGPGAIGLSIGSPRPATPSPPRSRFWTKTEHCSCSHCPGKALPTCATTPGADRHSILPAPRWAVLCFWRWSPPLA